MLMRDPGPSNKGDGYRTNFDPESYGNNEELVQQANERYGIKVEIRTHPMPSVSVPGLHSLWFDGDDEIWTKWWRYYLVHIKWVGKSAHLDDTWEKEREMYASGEYQ